MGRRIQKVPAAGTLPPRTRGQYPGATENEIELRLGALTLGPDLMRRVFGWDASQEGW